MLFSVTVTQPASARNWIVESSFLYFINYPLQQIYYGNQVSHSVTALFWESEINRIKYRFIKKVSFYIVQYPVLSTAQRAFTLMPCIFCMCSFQIPKDLKSITCPSVYFVHVVQ